MEYRSGALECLRSFYQEIHILEMNILTPYNCENSFWLSLYSRGILKSSSTSPGYSHT